MEVYLTCSVHVLQKKSDCIEPYGETALLLPRFITSVNNFPMSLWSQSLAQAVIQHGVYFAHHGPI